MTQRIDTIVIVREAGKILLGMKKRGFGAGRWNGFGGKVHMGEEEVVEAAHRELKEEAGIRVRMLREVGMLHFSFAHDPSLTIECHIFEGLEVEGVPGESDEMRPEWFDEQEIPFDSMWADDRHWLPILIAGGQFDGAFHFDQDGSILRGRLNDAVF